jgi:hypothetical protein
MFEFPLQSQIILSQEQLAAVGCVAIESTYLELHVEAVIWMLSGLDAKRGPQFTGKVQLGNRLELLHSLGGLVLAGAKIVEFSSLVSDLKDSAAKRNTVIHGTWTSQSSDYLQLLADGPEKHPPARATKERPNKGPATISATEIMSIAQGIAGRRARLGRFVHETWPDGWRERPEPRQ